jgi:hypothetical protein
MLPLMRLPNKGDVMSKEHFKNVVRDQAAVKHSRAGMLERDKTALSKLINDLQPDPELVVFAQRAQDSLNEYDKSLFELSALCEKKLENK